MREFHFAPTRLVRKLALDLVRNQDIVRLREIQLLEPLQEAQPERGKRKGGGISKMTPGKSKHGQAHSPKSSPNQPSDDLGHEQSPQIVLGHCNVNLPF
jgi:hypothetical protein